MKRLQIQTLHAAGKTDIEVSELTEVSPRTVQRVCGEAEISDLCATDIARRSTQGRPSKVAEFRDRIETLLKSDEAMKSGAIAEQLREIGCKAKKSAIYAMVRSLRPIVVAEGIIRFEAVAGEFSQHDFGHVRVRYMCGTIEVIHFFASRLKFSRLVRVLIVADEKTESVCRGLVDAFGYFGGVPLISVFDNPRTITTGRDDKRPIWQSAFLSFCSEFGITAHATWPYRPQEKGAVENLVGFVKGFFKGRVFHDRAELIEKLAQWHQEVNDTRPSRATGEVPRQRHILELPRLKAFTLPRGGFTLKWSRRVRTDGYCDFEGKKFFAGFRFVGKMATLHVGQSNVDIFVDAVLVGHHPRLPANQKYSILPQQIPEVLTKKGGRSYVKRQLLIDLCPAAEWSLTEIRHRRPDRWETEVDCIFKLFEQHGEKRIAEAFAKAARGNVAGAEYIEAILLGEAVIGEVR